MPNNDLDQIYKYLTGEVRPQGKEDEEPDEYGIYSALPSAQTVGADYGRLFNNTEESIKLTDIVKSVLGERNYKREYELYHSKPSQKKRRAQRNKSRRKMVNAGKVKKGQDVHHKNGNPADTSMKNMVAMSKSKNRSMK